MAAQREGLETPAETTNREHALRELYAWVQEHAHICSEVVAQGAVDPASLASLQPGLKLSLERGRQLLEACVPEAKESLESAVVLAAMGSHPALEPAWVTGSLVRLARRPSHLPLSGGSRFAEEASTKGPAFVAQAPVVNTMAHLPNRLPPLPSRTYLKKSGS